MKKSAKILSMLLALSLLLSPAALADLSRGDRGEAVTDLQRMLFYTGFLFEEPDGIFGRNTEQAVKDYESYANLPADGVADELMLCKLSVTFDALSEEAHIISDAAYDNIDFSFFQGDGGLGIGLPPVALNASVIIDADQIYYSGSLNGEDGVYAMNPDGSNLRRISDIHAVLKAVSGGNLLVWHYEDDGCGALEVLRNDGTLETVGCSNNQGIAAGGRFYYGGSSIAEDGSDHQWTIASDPEYHDNCYPILVFNGYLYYMDANVVSGMAGYMGGGSLPAGGAISRLELASGYIDPVTGVGTRYIGYDDGRIYYQLENVDVYDENGEMTTIGVDEGLFCIDLVELERTRLADSATEELIFDTYRLVKDGVVYGERFSYLYNENGSCDVLMVQADGEMLNPVPLNEGRRIEGFYAANGRYYGTGIRCYETGDEYYTADVLTIVDTCTGDITEIELDKNETMFYTETPARIAVVNDGIYYCVQNKNDGSESLKAMNPDGSNIRTLFRSDPLF